MFPKEVFIRELYTATPRITGHSSRASLGDPVHASQGPRRATPRLEHLQEEEGGDQGPRRLIQQLPWGRHLSHPRTTSKLLAPGKATERRTAASS